MNLSQFFVEPLWLVLALAAIPALWWFFRHAHQARIRALHAFASKHLIEALASSVSWKSRKIKQAFLMMGVLSLILALARPRLGFRWEEVKRKGIDILLAVDTSRSMLAQDVNPDRLTRAKMAVFDLVSKLEGDRVGLIAFAGSSFLQCPLTLDYDAFRQSLDVLDSQIIPRGGTNIASAIHEAEMAFKVSGSSHKILVLITDGENLEADAIEAAERAKKQIDMKIYTVGVGTPAGELIPLRTESGGVDFLKDENGQVVKSRLDESLLKEIAERTGGFYQSLGQRGEGLEAIYESGLATLPKQDLASRFSQVPIERFQWFVGFGLFCLVFECLLGDRRKKEKFSFHPFRWFRNRSRSSLPQSIGKAVVVAGLFSLAPEGEASPQKGEKAYQQGDFEKSMKAYQEAAEKRPDNALLKFNLGAAFYKNKNWDEALVAFQKALQTDQPALQQQTFYNLGNTQYRIGERTEKENPKLTIETWQQALQSYESALKLKPDDADAKFNYEFVKKKLEQLQQQQPKNNQENQDSKQNQNSNDSQDPSQKNEPNESTPDSKQDSGSAGSNDSEEKKDPSQSQPQPNQKKENSEDQSSSEPKNSKGDKEQKSQSGKEKQDPKPLPGQMSKEEAENLLDSLKGDEKKIRIPPSSDKKEKGEETEPLRDW